MPLSCHEPPLNVLPVGVPAPTALLTNYIRIVGNEPSVLDADKRPYSCRRPFAFVSGTVIEIMKKSGRRFVVSKLNTDEEDASKEIEDKGKMCVEKLGRKLCVSSDIPLHEYTVAYLGDHDGSLINWMMNLNKCRFCTYDTERNETKLETLNTNKMLMKRYYMIERAKDANIVGILVRTLAVKDHLVVVERMKNVIKAAGKKSYTFVVCEVSLSFCLSPSNINRS